MAQYEVGGLTTNVTTANPALEVVAGTGAPMTILEIGIFLNAATASTFALGRPGNTPAGGTVQTATKPANLVANAPTSAGGFILSGQSTVPTAPAAGNTLRQIAFPNVIGNGIIWTWDMDDLIVSPVRSDGLVLWNLSAVSAVRFYIKWRE